MIVNVSTGKTNYSQRNNLKKPFESCNVTSMVMALSYLEYVFPKGQYEQPEDNLREFIEARGKNPEIHYDLSTMTNEWMGKKVTDFSTERKTEDIYAQLIAGNPVVISGTFPGFPVLAKKPLGHIVCLVGAEWEGNEWNKKPDKLIWDDPYGNTLLNWKDSGNDIIIPYDKFISWIKPVGSEVVKWGHFFRKV
jgi:hypothetical protein